MDHPKKEWTVMIYMAGDNNLSEDMITALKGLKDAAPHHQMNVVAAYDSNYPPAPIKVYDLSGDLGTRRPRGSRLRDFETDIGVGTQTDGYGAEDNLSIETFVTKAAANYPADHYALILSGHGDGVLGRTLMRDENPSFVLDVVRLREILERCMPTDDDDKPKKFDLLGFDGCLMAMIEVCNELRGVADILVGSQGNIPTAGWNMREMVTAFASGTDQTATGFAKAIVAEYAEANKDYDVSGRSIEIAAIDLTKVRGLTKEIHRLADHLKEFLGLVPKDRERATDAATHLDRLVRDHFVDCILLAHYESQLFMHNQAVDIDDFLGHLVDNSLARLAAIGHDLPPSTTTETQSQPDSTLFRKILNRTLQVSESKTRIRGLIRGEDASSGAVILNDTAGAHYQFSTGLGILFPWNTISWNMIKARYSDFQFSQNTSWSDLIEQRLKLTVRTHKDKQQIADDGLKLRAAFKDVELAFTSPSPMSSGSDKKRDEATRDFIAILPELFATVAHREHTGKEHTGKEHTGKGEEFYRYFARFQNFPPWGKENADSDRSDDEAEKAVGAS